MYRVYACLARQHDLRLVLVAGLVCLLASWTALSLARRGAGDRRGQGARPVWLAIAAVVTGCGIWATHFVGVLAFGAGMPVGYDLWLTVLSVVVAIALTGCGFAIAARGGAPRLWLAGAVAGTGIGAMHYTGMAVLRVPARMGWDAGLVAASVLLGVGLGSAAFRAALDGAAGAARTAAGTLLLATAICATHFTGMGALHLEASPLLPLPEHRLSPGWLAVGVAAAASVVLAFAIAGAVVDQHLTTRTAREAARLRAIVQLARLPA